MKRLIYCVMVLALLTTLTACSDKRADEYPSVFGIDGEPKVLETVDFVDPAPVDITPKKKLYMDMVTPSNVIQPQQPMSPNKVQQPVDIFNLTNEVAAPRGCTSGVDC